MMKTILLIRHAKSSWSNFSINDSERPLNERGKKNAPQMAKRLLKKKIAIDAFLSSPASRALTTAQLFAKEYGYSAKNIIVMPELYMAGHAAFITAISSAPEEAKTIAVFSHNYGITEFANSLGVARIDNMPTCSIFAFTAAIDSWQDFNNSVKTFAFFDSPKAVPGDAD
ncbi:MAG: histidine phosphatase family protein [Flavitalea sp.]